jgi:hypothetical protein
MERSQEASASPKNTHDLTLCWPYTDAKTTHSNYPNWSDMCWVKPRSWALISRMSLSKSITQHKALVWNYNLFFSPWSAADDHHFKNRQGVLKKEAPTPLVEEKSCMVMCPWDPRNFLQVFYYWKAASGTKMGTLFFWLFSLQWRHHAFYHIFVSTSFSAHLCAQTSMWYFIVIFLFV